MCESAGSFVQNQTNSTTKNQSARYCQIIVVVELLKKRHSELSTKNFAANLQTCKETRKTHNHTMSNQCS